MCYAILFLVHNYLAVPNWKWDYLQTIATLFIINNYHKFKNQKIKNGIEAVLLVHLCELEKSLMDEYSPYMWDDDI